MKLRGEKLARSLLVNDSFDQVAKIPFVKNKWITAEAWLDLIKKEIPNCAITDITLRCVYLTKCFLLFLFSGKKGCILTVPLKPFSDHSTVKNITLFFN